jgi:bacillithiol system protein YtxJ
MPANLIRLDSMESLDRTFERSLNEPVVVFKHSTSCGISAHLLYQVEAIEADVHVVVVQESRPVSNALEQRTGVRHASPQAFVLRDGQVVYHASHYGIDPRRIAELL